MKIIGLILVLFYAALMLFALWKQHSLNASSLCTGAGSLLVLGYALLYLIQNRSLLPLLVIGMLCISAGALLNGIRLKKVHIHHHIIRLLLEAAMVALCWMSMGGGSDKLVDMGTIEIDGAQAVVWEDRTYVPFCVVSKSDCGAQIGFLNGDTDDRISAYQEYPTNQWLVSWLPMDGGAILLKEITVTQIPEGLEDEYQITP